MQCVISHNNWRKLQWCKWVWLSCSVIRGPRITRTTYNAVSVHGSRRPRYNGAAVYLLSKHVCRQDGSNEYPKSILYRACNEEFIGANVPKNIMLYHVRLMETNKKNQMYKQQQGIASASSSNFYSNEN